MTPLLRQPLGLAGRLFAFLIAILPTRLRLLLGDAIGILWFDIFRIRRKVAIENVTIAFPEKSLAERTQIARDSLRSMGRTLTEFSLFPFFSQKHVDRLIKIENEHYLDEALAQGKGVLMLTLHVGNGDLGAAALSLRGRKVHLISKLFKARWLNDMWFGMRSRVGTKFISPEKSSFEILRALKKNEIVIFVLDQFMGPPIGTRTKFFGKETGTAMGLALMADRTGAPVLPTYIYRNPDGTHVIVAEPPIPYLDNGLREENIAAMTQIYTDKVEDIVRRHPGQWMWIHRRWKEFRD